MNDKPRPADGDGVGELPRTLDDLRVRHTHRRRIVEDLSGWKPDASSQLVVDSWHAGSGSPGRRPGGEERKRKTTHHTRLGPAGDVNSDLLQAALEPARELVHGRQEGEVVRECVGGGRGHETGLAHAPTKQLPEPASLLDECAKYIHKKLEK